MSYLRTFYKKPSLKEFKASLIWYAYLAPYCLAILSLVTAYSGSSSFYILALFEHFRLQYLILGIVFLGFSIFHKRPPLILASIIIISVNYYLLSPYVTNSWKDSEVTAQTTLKVSSFNIYTANPYKEEFISQLLKLKLDIAVILEVNNLWFQSLQQLTSEYPYTISKVREDNFGIALFSKYPIKNAQVIELFPDAPPSLKAKIEVHGKTFQILATHPVPPVSQKYLELRDQQLASIALNINQSGTDYQVVLGDLNITPWSQNFKKLLAVSNLQDARSNFGYHATWPSHKKIMFIPIDYILVDKSLRTLSFESIPILGSDHYGIIARLK